MKDQLALDDKVEVSITDDDDTSEPQDSLSFLLDDEDDESIDSLIPEPKKSRKKKPGDNGRKSLLASMPKVEWWATRRVLYITQASCKFCGETYQLPSQHVLTEFVTSSGDKKWARQNIPDDPTLPVETEILQAPALCQCPNCLS